MKTFSRNIKTHQSFRYIGTISNTPEGISIRKQLRPLLRSLGEIKSNGRSANRKSFEGKPTKTGKTEYDTRSFVPTQYATSLDLYVTFSNPNMESNRGKHKIESVLTECGLL